MMSKAKDDKSLYERDFFKDKRSPALMEASKALYGRLNFYKDDAPAWKDLDVDTADHYYIAARHAIRAFHRRAEAE
jgi:hypothetical protein